MLAIKIPPSATLGEFILYAWQLGTLTRVETDRINASIFESPSAQSFQFEIPSHPNSNLADGLLYHYQKRGRLATIQSGKLLLTRQGLKAKSK